MIGSVTRVKRATWTEWVPTSFGPSRSSRLSRAAILWGASLCEPHVRIIEVLAYLNGFSAACM